jgi:riboflavin kinase / FMN adenylyltransferase
MKVVKSFFELDAIEAPDVAVTFGNYDGFHLGHKKLISSIVGKIKEKKLKLVLVTFSPHPRQILSESTKPFLITSRERRLELLDEAGVDYLLEIPFTRDFSTLDPLSFLERYILIYKNIKSIYLGWDFAFGANKAGDSKFLIKTMKTHFPERVINIEVMPQFEFDYKHPSSTSIRESIFSGDVEKAQSMLGRPFSIDGVIVKGAGRGKLIGIPTANLKIDGDLIIPLRGVYITDTIYKGLKYRSVTNIGRNPTFVNDDVTTVETHIIDFLSDIYGETIRVEFLKRLRAEKKFANVPELVDQIKNDIQEAKDYKVE